MAKHRNGGAAAQADGRAVPHWRKAGFRSVRCPGDARRAMGKYGLDAHHIELGIGHPIRAAPPPARPDLDLS